MPLVSLGTLLSRSQYIWVAGLWKVIDLLIWVLVAISVDSRASTIVQSGVKTRLIVGGLGTFFGWLWGSMLLGVFVKGWE